MSGSKESCRKGDSQQKLLAWEGPFSTKVGLYKEEWALKEGSRSLVPVWTGRKDLAGTLQTESTTAVVIAPAFMQGESKECSCKGMLEHTSQDDIFSYLAA